MREAGKEMGGSGGNRDNGRIQFGWLLPDATRLIDSGEKASNDAAGTEADALPTELTPRYPLSETYRFPDVWDRGLTGVYRKPGVSVPRLSILL